MIPLKHIKIQPNPSREEKKKVARDIPGQYLPGTITFSRHQKARINPSAQTFSPVKHAPLCTGPCSLRVAHNAPPDANKTGLTLSRTPREREREGETECRCTRAAPCVCATNEQIRRYNCIYRGISRDEYALVYPSRP